MNFLHLSQRVSDKLVYLFRLICFYVKKPFYVLSYNSNGNRFVCDGVFLNSCISLSGRNNAIIVEGGGENEQPENYGDRNRKPSCRT